MEHRTPSETGMEILCSAASNIQAWCKVHNMLYPAAVSCSTPHQCSVSRSPQKWFLVSKWSSLQQGLHDHYENVGQISEPTPDDDESEQSSHNTENMNVAESMSLQAGRPTIEPKKWALPWRVCHFYETSLVRLAWRLNHCLSHIPAHMMNFSLKWCWKQVFDK